jgi:RNA polymerase sigma-70 factor (ECF subfamily)
MPSHDSLNEMAEEPTAHRSDHDLIRLVLEFGDERAFRDLYRRHTPRLLGFVSRLLAGAEPEDEDVVQETWIRACGRLGQFEWRSEFSTWLIGIGLNVVRDQLRRSGRSRTIAADCAPDPHATPPAHESRIDLERAIRMLPDDYRLVLVLHDVEGIKHHEIAERLGIPLGTAKSHLFRARRMMRDRLSERNGVKR